jgi:hypothetical protein
VLISQSEPISTSYIPQALVPLEQLQLRAGTKQEQKEISKKITALKFRIFLLQSLLKFLNCAFTHNSKITRHPQMNNSNSNNNNNNDSKEVIWNDEKVASFVDCFL